MRRIAMEDLLTYRFLSGLRLSKDGAYAAFAVSNCKEDQSGYHSELWLLRVADGSVRPLTAAGKERAFSWTAAGDILFPAQRTQEETKAAKEGPATAFYRIAPDGGEARFAFRVPLRGATAEQAAEGYLVRAVYDPQDEVKSEGPKADVQVFDEIPFWFNGKGVTNKKRARLYHYVPETDALTPLTPPLGEVGAAAISPDGTEVVYAMTVFDSVNPQKQALYATSLRTGHTRVLMEGDTWRIGSVAFMGGGLVLTMADGARYGTSENARLYTLPLAGGTPALLAAPDVDICGNTGSDCRLGGGQVYLGTEDALYLTLGIDNSAFLYRVRPDGGMEALTDGEGSVDCFDVHGKTVLFIGMRDMGLQEVYALRDGKAQRLTSLNDAALRDCHVTRPAPLSFENADGIRIDGWVMTPPDFDPAGSYPGILNVHGGPKVAMGDLFFHEMQFWAARGYVVFYCNPRGSGGRGDAFADVRGKYGTIDYDDLMAFCDRVLVAYPAVDAARLCVAGGSYGGFMVNWIIGHTARFAAAASQRSIANWTSKCLTTDIGYYHNLSQIAGDPWQTPELFWEKSPLKHVPNAQTPTLFIHSDEDYRCWMSEGIQMFTALKMHGVPTRMCLFEGENHELSRAGKPVNRLRRLAEITAWFDQYTGMGPENTQE